MEIKKIFLIIKMLEKPINGQIMEKLFKMTKDSMKNLKPKS
jgi:hypothetical protein